MSRNRWCGAALAGLMVVAAAAPVGVGAASKPQSPNPWMTVNAGSKQVTLNVVAGATSANAGFNFDGFGKGALTFIVPKGWSVKLQFSNKGALPHSAAIVASLKSTKAIVATPNATTGVAKGKTQVVSFMASAPGKYYLVCLVPGHVAAGMWDNVTISSTAKTPSMTAVK